jgi:hypothetical protein
MTDAAHTFTHHGHSFVIEADGWPDEESAYAAIIDLQLWTIRHDAGETATLRGALEQEREALVSETPYDRDAAPLPAVRDAQRRATQSGLQGRSHEGERPTVTLEPWQVQQA